jgi:hypothetical protein
VKCGIQIDSHGNLAIGNSARRNSANPANNNFYINYADNFVGAVVATQSAMTNAANDKINVSY